MFRKLLIISVVSLSSVTLSAQIRQYEVSVRDTITDRELTIPEDIERNFDQLFVDWKKDFSPAANCHSNFDTNISFADSIYINRLYRLPSEMELVYNPIVRSYIDMYTGRMRNSVEYFVGKSNYYFPIFEEALDKYGLPLELKYLPIIESALNPTIVSRAGATGLWQFMIGTGKMYNLEINSLVDERRDPLKSTEAAARYLKDLYNIYGDWNLVIAAYNCGPGNVNKAIKRSNGETDYWSIYPYLPKETRGYVPAFIAATYVMNYYKDHNICPFDYKYTKSTDTIVVNKQLHLQQLADVLNIPMDEVRNLNPQYKKDIVPGEFKEYIVTLPSMKASDFEIARDSVYSYRSTDFLSHRKVVEAKGTSPSLSNAKKYRVRKGDNLGGIASRHGITIAQLKQWNRLKSNRLRAGQLLAVSNPTAPKAQQQQSDLAQAQTSASETSGASTSGTSNTLSDYFNRTKNQSDGGSTDQNGEDTSEDTNLSDEDNKARIQDLQGSRTIYHKVRIGETLTQIASKYNVEKDDISKWNKLKRSVPKVGRRLVIHLPKKEEIKQEVPVISPESVGEVMASTKSAVDEGSTNRVVASVDNPPLAANLNDTAQPSKNNNNPIPEKSTPVNTNKPKTRVTKRPAIYIVKKGDTLGYIASKYGAGVTIAAIRKANNLGSDRLSIGQKLKIPR